MFFKTASLLCICLAVSVASAAPVANSVITLDGPDWRLAPDPNNVGVAEKWCEAPRPDAKPTKVPWIIQQIFPGYSGYAWYWRDVDIPANPHDGGRYLLRFWDVDYLADVWVNGKHIGQHEGAQTRFTFDATDAVKPGARTVSPSASSRSPARWTDSSAAKRLTAAIAIFNYGGIFDSVELLIVPQVRMDDLFVRANPKTGKIRIEAEICNASKKAVKGSIGFSVTPANSGESISTVILDREIPPGTSTIRTEMQVANPRLWQLNDPQLYRMKGCVAAAGSNSVDETSTRFGFREFRFENGYFRLNGKRVFWRSALRGRYADHDSDSLRSRPRAAGLDLSQGDGFQRHPVHIDDGASLPTRYVRRDRSDGLPKRATPRGWSLIRRNSPSGRTERSPA